MSPNFKSALIGVEMLSYTLVTNWVLYVSRSVKSIFGIWSRLISILFANFENALLISFSSVVGFSNSNFLFSSISLSFISSWEKSPLISSFTAFKISVLDGNVERNCS